jgi:hypothetical protein
MNAFFGGGAAATEAFCLGEPSWSRFTIKPLLVLVLVLVLDVDICGPDFIAILGSSSISVVSKSGQPALVYFGEQ